MERLPQLLLGLAIVSAGIGIGGTAVGDGLRQRDQQEMITVTGSARRTIVSDTIVWRASVTSTQPTPAEASRELAAWVERVRSFLEQAGAKDDEVRVDPVSTDTIFAQTPDGRFETGRVVAYRLSRTFEVRSGRVKEVTGIIQGSGDLLSEGIPLTAQPPEYRYAQLAKIRPELLADASRDAKNRGQRLVAAAGGKLGRLQSVSAGVIQITAPNSSDTSGEGVYDTSTIDKDVTAVVRLTFGLR